MNRQLLWSLLVACFCASTGCAISNELASNAKCAELRSHAGDLVGLGEKTISIASGGKPDSAENVVIRSVLDQWNGLISHVSPNEVHRLAESALPCARYQHSALNLFVATVGLQSDRHSELENFARGWFFSKEAGAQPISSLGRAVLKERTGDRNGAEAEIRHAIAIDPIAVARRAGLLYLSGTFFPSDDAEGASWVKEAADSGDWRAQRLMALLYTAGRGVTRDDVAAEKYVKLAGENPLDERKAADEAIISIRPLPPNKH